jgi:hypothetical protein
MPLRGVALTRLALTGVTGDEAATARMPATKATTTEQRKVFFMELIVPNDDPDYMTNMDKHSND